MPTFRDPLTDAAEASEAMRGLAHASRVFDDPADTYPVFGDLTATMRSLRQVLDQLANTHLAHRDRAQHDDGDHLAGDRSALAAADELHRAGTLLDQAHDHLNTAFSHSGRIAWHPEPVVDRDAARERLAARLDGDPAPTTVQAGTLTLTVWPDTPAGEHQRYAYRIIDTTTGRELEGRDLFTGAGQPVDPDHAIRDLATFLGAAGEAGEGARGEAAIAQRERQAEPGQDAAIRQRVLADLVECADEGRVLRGTRRRADGGGQRIAPGERVGIGEGRGPRIEAVEQVEGGRAVSRQNRLHFNNIM